LSSIGVRSFHSSAILYYDQSKIEKTVNLLKKDKINEEKVKQTISTLPPTINAPIIRPDVDLATTTPAESGIVKSKSLWDRFLNEIKHYYNGFKLLFIETKIAFRLLRQVLNGHTLTRRERKQVFKKIQLIIFLLIFFHFSLLVQFLIYFDLYLFLYLLLFHLWNLHYQFF